MKKSMLRFRAVKTCAWVSLAGALIAPLSVQAQYRLTVNPDNPSHGSTAPSGTVMTNDFAEIDATGTPPYAFANWDVRRGDVDFSFDTNLADNSVLLLGSTNENYIIRANFAIPEYDLTLIDRSPAGADGNVFLDPPGGTYSNGTAVTIEAVPDPGNVFNSFSYGTNTSTNAEITVTMDRDITVFYDFKEGEQLTLTVDSYDDDGDVVGSPVVIVNDIAHSGSGDTKWDFGTVMSIEVDETDLVAPGVQLIEPIWEKDFGSGNIGSGQVTVPNFTLTNNTKYTYTWTTQYLLTVDVVLPAEGGADGDVNRVPVGDPGPTEGTWWYNAQQSVDLTAVPVQGLFSQWGGDASGINRGITMLMDGPKFVQAFFAETILDNDNDGLPDNWEAQFGLDTDDGSPFSDSGPWGDPDNDGVPNLTEYRISYEWLTNHAVYAVSSPINADSDGDGMDDGYEMRRILNLDPVADGTPVDGNQMNAVAVVDPTGTYGPNGNPDQDFHWNTDTGYETVQGLVNIEEYLGPDDQPPGLIVPTTISNITETVFRMEPNPADTGDQSGSDSTDSEISSSELVGDGFDDGFEYSWDRWQGRHAGDPVGDPLGHRVPYREDVGILPASIVAADFNEDGSLDLATANSGLDEVSILLGHETTNGTFNLPTEEIAVGGGPRALAVADLNGDGTTNDLIVVNETGDSVTVLLCAGDGTFSSSVDYPVGTQPADLVVGDFNGDGIVDVAVCNEGSHDVSVLIGGGGDLFTVSSVSAGLTPVSIDAGSLVSTNGALDLVVANRAADSWTILENDGSGNFSISVSQPTGADPSCIRVADVTDDGIEDVIVSCFGSDEIRTYVGAGGGSFTEPAGSAFSVGAGRGPRHFVVSDFDSDTDGLPGYPDVAVVNQAIDPGLVAMLLGNQGAGWAQGSSRETGSDPTWVIAEDFNLDGVMDLAVAERGEDSLIVFLGRGGGLFDEGARYETSQIVGDRRFNPARVHVQPPDGGRRDYDLRYDPQTAGVGDWLTDGMEYNAWQDAVSPILRTQYPDRRRCSHPFLWDADGDRLPDGWELAFGYDPWDYDTGNTGDNDGAKNPDGDWFAGNSSNKHSEVYQTLGFNPTTAWWYQEPYVHGPGADTMRFTNYEELIGPRGFAAIAPHDPNDTGTHPSRPDTDGDGIWDGWEWYVGLNAKVATDAALDPEGDDVANRDEFLSYATSSTNQADLTPVAEWYNKILPTDPWDPDTDNDQVGESAERDAFNAGDLAFETGSIEYPDLPNVQFPVYANGGMNPTSADTDGDYLPDNWENHYAATPAGDVWAGGMNPTIGDAHDDPDGDGLLNYQEYMCGAVYMWQFQYNSGAPAYEPGLGLYGYDPFDFFDETLSDGGQWDVGPGGRAPWPWDARYSVNGDVDWKFMTGAELNGLWFSTADPRDTDTDGDGMDDYYEVYHGLNPLFGIYDIVRSKVAGANVPVYHWLDQNNMPIAGVPDLDQYPWIAGDPVFDPDQDEIPNIYESIQPEAILPDYHHTDPSPMWMTDTSSSESLVNQHYWLGNVFGGAFPYYWYWDDSVLAGTAPPPSYMFSFEVNEGYDTDNDNLADRAELQNDPASPGVTDPLDSQSPIKRRALYLDGTSAARTMHSYYHDALDFRQFSLEAWVRPETPATGAEQVVIERAGMYLFGNEMDAKSGIRANFRLGLDGAGRPFVGYHGAGEDIIFVEAKAEATAALPAGEWTHLAATYGGERQSGGQWIGSLKLYANGSQIAATGSSLIPANGFYGGLATGSNIVNTGWVFSMPIVVGAGDANPEGWVDQAPILVGPSAGFVKSAPSLRNHFRGWVDQVHIWTGERTQSAIENNMQKRYTRPEVQELVTSDPGMRYVFSFDDLPDPDYSPIAPHGFNLLNGRPMAYTASPWWASAADASLVYTDYRYIPWIDNLAGHFAQDPPRDSVIPAVDTNQTAEARYPNTTNPYTLEYVHGTSALDEEHPHLFRSLASTSNVAFRTYLDLLPLGSAVADEDVELWDGSGTGRDPYDTDEDGMADDWETAYGLDPNSGEGKYGSWGDPDLDGLPNWAEYMAWLQFSVILEPFSADSLDDGVLDYDSRPSANSPTFGQLYDDWDGMSGLWEIEYGLDPHSYDGHIDSDGDGWSNFAEFMGATDPSEPADYPQPTFRFLFDYAGQQAAAPIVVHAYSTPSMDGVPNATFVAQGNVSRVLNDFVGVGTGGSRFLGSLPNIPVVPGTLTLRFIPHSVVASDDGQGNIVHSGEVIGAVDYGTGGIDVQVPVAAGTGADIVADYSYGQQRFPFVYSAAAADVGHVREGRNWFFAFMDTDDSGSWSPGEPATIAEYQPVEVSWGTVDVSMPLSDRAFGYPRFEWVATAAEYTDVEITIPGQGLKVFEKRIHGPRSYVHEGDLVHLDVSSPWYSQRHGLSVPVSTPIYSWTARSSDGQVDSGSFTFAWQDPKDPPRQLPAMRSPVGSSVPNALVEFQWTMDERNAAVRFQLRNAGGSTLLIDEVFPLPRRRRGVGSDFYYSLWPQYCGRGFTELPDGVYEWRVIADNYGTLFDGSPSSWASVTLNRASGPTGPYRISGRLDYFGPMTTLPVKVQAFRRNSPHIGPDGIVREGFGSRPYAQVTVTSPTADFDLRGLPEGIYFVRAFIDQNGSGVPETWETRGFFLAPAMPDLLADRSLQAAVVGLSQSDTHVTLRDRDTDSDKLPDSWEYAQTGNLTSLGMEDNVTPIWQSGPLWLAATESAQVAAGAVPGDSNQDGLPDMFNVYLGTQALLADTDADGFGDLVEFFSGSDPTSGEGRPFSIPSLHVDADGRPVVGWDVPGLSLTLVAAYRMAMVYDIQWRESLLDGQWQTVGQRIVMINHVPGRYEWTDYENEPGAGYYRIQARLSSLTP